MKRLISLAALSLFVLPAIATAEGFSKGPVIADYGENVLVDGGLPAPESQQFKVVFDVSEANDKGDANKRFNTLARFINMHARAGVPEKNIQAAMVVHGKASFDLMSNAAYKAKFDKDNASAELLGALLDAGVNVYLCGQSAAFLGVAAQDLQPGVTMSLSAITANALLQQQGYTLNPF